MVLWASQVEERGRLQGVGLLGVPRCSRLSVSRVSQYSTLHRCAPPPHRSRPAVFPLSFSEVAFNSFRSPLQQVFPSEYLGIHVRRDTIGFVAKLHLRRFVLWSLPAIYGAQRGRTTMAISFKGAYFPQDI
jgi:hypothetical protein